MSARDMDDALDRMLGRPPTEAERAIAGDQARRLEAGVYAHPLTLPPAYGPLRLVGANDLVRHDPFAPLPSTDGTRHDD